MIGSRDDLRETLARAVHRETDDGSDWALMPEEHRDCWRQSADRIRAEYLAPILAQVSALQAEVERERHNKEQWRDQSYENAKAADRLSAEVERLQKGLDLAADEATSHRNAAVAALRERDAALERLQKIEGERGRLAALVDALGEADAAGKVACVASNKAFDEIWFGEREPDPGYLRPFWKASDDARSQWWRAVNALEAEARSRRFNSLTETKEGSEHV